MGYRLREIETERKFSRELTLQAIEQAVPMGEIAAVLQEEDAQEVRERKLNMVVVDWLVIAMNLYVELSLKHLCYLRGTATRVRWEISARVRADHVG